MLDCAVTEVGASNAKVNAPVTNTNGFIVMNSYLTIFNQLTVARVARCLANSATEQLYELVGYVSYTDVSDEFDKRRTT